MFVRVVNRRPHTHSRRRADDFEVCACGAGYARTSGGAGAALWRSSATVAENLKPALARLSSWYLLRRTATSALLRHGRRRRATRRVDVPERGRGAARATARSTRRAAGVAILCKFRDIFSGCCAPQFRASRLHFAQLSKPDHHWHCWAGYIQGQASNRSSPCLGRY